MDEFGAQFNRKRYSRRMDGMDSASDTVVRLKDREVHPRRADACAAASPAAPAPMMMTSRRLLI